MGCCKKALRTNTLVGTPEYFAPETILGKGYSCAIDWWALGVMMHEFIVGPLPFGRHSEDQLELFKEILEAALSFPSYVTDQTGVGVVTGLLERTPEMRLGASTRGAKEIKDHPYFVNFDWDALAGRYMPAPWTPNQQKLQASWEVADADQSLVGDDLFDASKPEPGYEWATTF
uniref:Protein kinase domain-containing protein n=1 Tax=Zooxanthella nutricula TaxID=1333877 RepID=A0A7S2KBU1_9DINO